MAVNISKSGQSQHHGPAPGSEDLVARFRQTISNRLAADYCETSERDALIREALSTGLDRATAEAILDLELESGSIANEHKLLQNLEAILRRFTDQDKKLDDKERRDAIQLACRPAGGYRQGLRYDVAERFLVQFCRSNGVKVKTGFMRWSVP